MRSEKDLDAELADAIRVSNGSRPDRPCQIVILARDEEEYLWLVARLKGKHRAKAVGVKRAFSLDLARAM